MKQIPWRKDHRL